MKSFITSNEFAEIITSANIDSFINENNIQELSNDNIERMYDFPINVEHKDFIEI